MWEGKVGSTYVREWVSEDSKANIVIIHGVGEHSGRYLETAESLFEQGFNVYTGDLVGHGMSDGSRIYIDSIEDYMGDVDFFLKRINNDKPKFLLGHSMGGFIVLYYMLINKDTFDGVIALSPYIKDKIKIPAPKYFIGKVAATLLPRLKIESGLKGEMVCRDEAIVKQYDIDPLNCSKVTARWFVEVEKARNYLIQKQADFTSPCLVLQAGSDIVVDAAGVQQFFDGISSKDKEYITYNDFYHEILNDTERACVIDKIGNWINQRL